MSASSEIRGTGHTQAGRAGAPSAGNLLNTAIARHRAGRLSEAAGLYQALLTLEPAHADAWHLLGLTELQSRREADALALFDRALRITRDRAEYHNSVGEGLRTQGDMAAAAAAYRKAVTLRPDYAEPVINLTRALHLLGQPNRARASGRRAVALAPERIEGAINLAHALLDLGRFSEAQVLYHRALALQPDHVEAIGHLSRVARGSGDPRRMETALRRAMRMEPLSIDHPQALGDLFIQHQDLVSAEHFYRRVVALKPDHPEAQNGLGSACLMQKRYAAAKPHYRRSMLLRPDYPSPHNNMANALWELGEAAAARTRYRQAIALKPDHPDAYGNLGHALRTRAKRFADYREAEKECRRALRLDPGNLAAGNNLGIVHLSRNELKAAEERFRQVLARSAENADAHFNLSLTLLKAGALAEGWKHYEWRWRTGQLPLPNLSQPRWQGEPLEGRSILVYAEQGHGDTLHFARYVPLLAERTGAERAGRVTLVAQPGLVRLLKRMPGIDSVHAVNEPVRDFDVHTPLLSLPGFFGTTLDTIPVQVPYLAPDPADIETWRQRIPVHGGVRIGLVWAGDPRPHMLHANATDQRRSMALSDLAPLATIPGAVFFSLQKGKAGAQSHTPPRGMAMIDLMDEVNDFADTAALISALDLVICVDTSVAHLAGALGKPVWVLSRFDGCWRWLTGRQTTPWYPTMRLFHQTRPGEWATVVESVARALQVFVEERLGASA
ncbi:tetratricopeptide repeat protein [Azospirillum sp. 412522]|nr:tetratricopeptide repeat protein [Azospirillum sp. 412522]MBY6264852.1 tetratricopeptide repeat protein [Azospirillum sp. 412522]